MKKINKNIGFAAIKSEWEYIFGDQLSCQQLNSSSLWWAPQEQQQFVPSFDDYVQIGGWKQPYMKLFNQTSICGMDAALNYYITRSK